MTVTVDPASRPDGLYGGWLTATGPGGTMLHTAIGIENQPQLETLTFRGIDRRGRAVPGADLAVKTFAFNLENGNIYSGTILPSDGALAVAVPPGPYEVVSTISTAATSTSRPSVTLIDDTHVAVDHDLTLTFDARLGVPVTAVTDRRAGNAGISIGISDSVSPFLSFVTMVNSFFNQVGVYAVPTPRVSGRNFAFWAQIELDNGSSDPNHTLGTPHSPTLWSSAGRGRFRRGSLSACTTDRLPSSGRPSASRASA